MPSSPNTDLLIVVALARFVAEFDESHPALAAVAWVLPEDHVHRRGLRPIDTVSLL
jgi:hypothetical protein